MTKPTTKTIKLLRILRHLELSQYPLGRLECAKGGCRYCDEQVHESFQIEMEVMAALPDYEPCDYFNELIEYVAFRKACPLNKKGRPPQTDQEMIRDLEIGRYAEIIHRKGKTVEEAIADTAEKYFGSLAAESKVRDARKEFLDAVKLLNDEANQKNGE
jgi:hypothetical protein